MVEDGMRRWLHSPPHIFVPNALYMVTGGTLHKIPIFSGNERLNMVQSVLIDTAEQLGWEIQAWALLPNHYHIIAFATESSEPLPGFIRRFHSITARKVNQMDKKTGRKVWFQYWDKLITYEKSYLARMNYVHNNPVKHGFADDPLMYPFCSASFFARKADPAFYRRVIAFPYNKLRIKDDF